MTFQEIIDFLKPYGCFVYKRGWIFIVHPLLIDGIDGFIKFNDSYITCFSGIEPYQDWCKECFKTCYTGIIIKQNHTTEYNITKKEMSDYANGLIEKLKKTSIEVRKAKAEKDFNNAIE